MLKNLEPNKWYDIRVKAGTVKGFPDNSQLTEELWPWVSAMTEEVVNGPPDPPDIQVSALNESAIQVSWDVSPTQGATRYYSLLLTHNLITQTPTSCCIILGIRHLLGK